MAKRDASESEASKDDPLQPIDEAPEPDDADEQALNTADESEPSTANHHEAAPGHEAGPKGKHRKLWQWAKTHKKLSIPAAVVLLIALLLAIPWTRYAVAGTFWKQDFKVAVVDSQTHKPVTSARVSLGSVAVLTDNQGKATLHARSGSGTLVVTKKYYKSVSTSVVVPILKPKTTAQVNLSATGRLVPVMISNTITGKPLANAVIKAGGSEAKSNAKGEATLVLSPNKDKVAATISAAGYNNAAVTVLVTAQALPANVFHLTPAGKLYFLSNLSGKIDVVKTDLDGQNRQTVLAGTGKEDRASTALLASRDWKYLALLAKRDSDQAKLYLIDTSNDSLTTMDEGDASFNAVGWSGDKFIYQVSRYNSQSWQPKGQALKSFDAPGKKITLLDETTATGTSSFDFNRETFGGEFIIGDEIIYSKNWFSAYNNAAMTQLSGRQATLNTVKSDGTNKKTVKGFSLDAGTLSADLTVELAGYEPKSLYVRFSGGAKTHFYEYEDAQVKDEPTLDDSAFYQGNAVTYLVSPSDKQTFWSELRDGKNAIFVGDANGKNGKQIASLSAYNTYGWFTDDYLLVTKNSSELFIMPTGGSDAPLKVSDYYKPDLSFRGYGSGYGGL